MGWNFYFVLLAIASFITFCMYGIDKTQSKIGGKRIPEIVFHFAALLGGFPGGWIGRAIFRHKTQKWIFTFVLIASTFLHLGILYLLFLERVN